jgi:hypothetical protein
VKKLEDYLWELSFRLKKFGADFELTPTSFWAIYAFFTSQCLFADPWLVRDRLYL